MSVKTIEEIRSQLGKPQVRSFVLDRTITVDENTRTVNLAFASANAVEHWFGSLILSMDPKNVRTDRLASGAPLLMDHNSRDQVGVVENFTFDKKEGMARADVRFDTAVRADEIYQSVKNGIRRNVSVGFMIYEIVLESEKDGEMPVYRCDDWEPLEISIVAMPADISVGVGRSLESAVIKLHERLDKMNPGDVLTAGARLQKGFIGNQTDIENSKLSSPSPIEREISQTEKTMKENENTPETPVVEARSAELLVVDEIREWGESLLATDLASAYIRENIADNGTFTGTKAGFFARIKAAKPPTVTVPAMDPKEQAKREGGVQFARTISRVNLQAFKGEGGYERAYRSGMHLAAVLLNDEHARAYCREHGIALTRTQTEGDNTKGGFTVIPEFEQTIFDLRLQYGVARRVTDVVPMASDTKIVTRRTGGLTAYAVGPHTRGTFSDITDDQFELVARKWMVLNKREDELSEDSFISWADRLANESAYAFSYAEDNCLFNADGTSTYHGIVGITQKILGLSATRADIAGAVVATDNVWSGIVIGDLLALVGKLPSFARTSGNVRWYCTSEFWATVLQRLALAAGGVTHAEFEGQLKESFLGKPVELVEAMQHVEANDTIPLLYGNLAQAVTFGDRRGITVKTTDSNDTDFEADLEATKATERFDINVHDVGNASATAGLRKAGPVVALLTAAS